MTILYPPDLGLILELKIQDAPTGSGRHATAAPATTFYLLASVDSFKPPCRHIGLPI
jgi:hypothetical protein